MGDQRLSFTFDKLLGKGGFGEVYLATLTRPGGLTKRVAVKVLKEDLRHAEAAVQRLRDEGRMLAILDHPCILRVLEMTLIKGRVALVTEYIDGIDLARCCRADRLLPQSVVLGALGEVASALHCAWTTASPETGKPLQLIHRDVKPENIRIGRHGEVKLLDFGIARTTEMFRHAKTAQGDLPFTPGYAAPEAFTKGFQGSASDIYALGVTMYRLLAAERLYEGMELSDQVTICCLPERYSPFLRDRLTKVQAPEPLLKLLREMLSYEPVHRPSAFEVEDRCATLARELDGPSHVRWARAQVFPEPSGLQNGSLTGQTVEEDVLQPKKAKSRGVKLTPKSGDSTRGLLDAPDNSSRSAPRPQASQEPKTAAVADLTPPMTVTPPPPPNPPASLSPQRPQPLKSLPPPVPIGMNSIRPTTAPFPKPEKKSPPSDPAPSASSASDGPPPVTPIDDAVVDANRASSTPSTFGIEPESVVPPPPREFNNKATLDAWMLEEDEIDAGFAKDADASDAKVDSAAETVERPPPEPSAPEIPPEPVVPDPPESTAPALTSAAISGPDVAPPAPTGGSSILRYVGIAVVASVLLGGLGTMLVGLAVGLAVLLG